MHLMIAPIDRVCKSVSNERGVNPEHVLVFSATAHDLLSQQNKIFLKVKVFPVKKHDVCREAEFHGNTLTDVQQNPNIYVA